MSLIDVVLDAWSERRKSITVAFRKGGDEVTLYFGPSTQADRELVDRKMVELYGKDREDWPLQAWRTLQIIAKAQFEDGTRAFDWSDLHVLMNKCDALVLDRLYSHLLEVAVEGSDDGDGEEARAEAGKESEPNPGSDSS